MPRLGHIKLNISGHSNRICQCGAVKIKNEDLFTYTSRPIVKDAEASYR